MPTGIYKRKKKIGLSARQVSFIKKNRLIMSGRNMERKFGFSKGYITRWMRSNGLDVPKRLQDKFRGMGNIGTTTSTPAWDKFLRKNYIAMPQKTMAKYIGKSYTFVATRLRQLGLIIPEEIRQKFKEKGMIRPGSIPMNKGKKWKDYMSPDAQRKARKTCFRKGHLPAGTLYDGAISTRHNHKDRNERPYKWIRTGLGKWEMLHVYNWKKKYGKIPKGKIVSFKTTDTMNCKINNLKLITREENMKRNSIHNLPEELKSTIMTLGALNRKINRYGKKQN